MNLIEPQAAYARRCGGVAPANSLFAPPQPSRTPLRPLGDSFWITAVFDTLGDNGDEPMRLTSLVNSVGKLGNYTRRADYDPEADSAFWFGRSVDSDRASAAGGAQTRYNSSN